MGSIGRLQWFSGFITHKIVRTPVTRWSIRQLKSPNDIDSWQKSFNRTPNDPTLGALFIYLIDKNIQNSSGVRLFPEGKESEDIVGLTFVFPEAHRHVPATYFTQTSTE